MLSNKFIYKYIQIHDGVGLLETLCDNQIPPLITTSSKHLKLNLETTYLFRTFGHKGLSAVYLLKGIVFPLILLYSYGLKHVSKKISNDQEQVQSEQKYCIRTQNEN